MTNNHYQILGISPTASQDEIEAAISRRAEACRRQIAHPDPAIAGNAARQLLLLETIRATLLDPQKRAAYDTGLGLKTESSLRMLLQFCENCGRQVRMGARFCPACGMALPGSTPGVAPPTPRSVVSPAAPARPVSSASPPTPPSAPMPRAQERPPVMTAQPAPVSRPPITAGLPRQAIHPPDSSSSPEVARYGRVEYHSPMDKDHEYPLCVGLLLERHGRSLSPAARVRWATLHVATAEEEPLIRVVPSSSYFRISPPMRDVCVRKLEDVYAHFRILPLQLPGTLENRCTLEIGFEYNGKEIHTVTLSVQVQEKFQIGRFQVSHASWKKFGFVGSAVVALDTAASLFSFFTPSASVLQFAFVLVGVLAVLALFIVTFLLWQKAGKRSQQLF